MIKPIKFEVELADYDSVREHIHLTQYDRGFNIEIDILEHGLPYTLQNDEAIQIDFELPKNSGYILSKESINVIDSNTISFAVNRNITLNFGIAKFNIAIVDKTTGITKKKSTNQYTIEIAPNALSEDFVNEELIVSAKEELDKSIENATEVLDRITPVDNKAFTIHSTDWTGSNPYTYTLNHNLNSTNIIVNAYDSNGEAINVGYKILNSNNIKFTALEKEQLKVVISADYYLVDEVISSEYIQEVEDVRDGMTSLGDKIRDMNNQLTTKIDNVNSSLDNKITTTKTELKQLISDTALATKKALHPVNSIYLSMDSTNPNTLFGFGTWQLIGQGRTLVGVDTNDNDFKTVNKTGGSKTQTLNIAQLPQNVYIDADTKDGTANKWVKEEQGSNWCNRVNWATNNTAQESVSIVQPYVTVYIWKRKA